MHSSSVHSNFYCLSLSFFFISLLYLRVYLFVLLTFPPGRYFFNFLSFSLFSPVSPSFLSPSLLHWMYSLHLSSHHHILPISLLPFTRHTVLAFLYVLSFTSTTTALLSSYFPIPLTSPTIISSYLSSPPSVTIFYFHPHFTYPSLSYISSLPSFLISPFFSPSVSSLLHQSPPYPQQAPPTHPLSGRPCLPPANLISIYTLSGPGLSCSVGEVRLSPSLKMPG